MEYFDKSNYDIKQIDYKIAMDLVVKNHYLHRRCPHHIAFGCIDKSNGDCVAVIVYGKPASNSLCKGICGEDESNNVIELSRLWVHDSIKKNMASYLIGNTLKLLDKEIIVSYADTSQNHIGKVYQATNWVYTGLSDKHCQWVILGEKTTHERHWADKYGGVKKAKEILGDKLIKTERPRKHRYIYFNCDKRRKKDLIKKLRYPIYNYPKGE